MIVNDVSSKIDLCIKELMLIKEILNSKVSDDFCSRILSTYAMVRVDDITKLWGHTIPKSDDSRKEYNMILKSYNEGLRVVRDKLGAHYQSPSKDVDLFASMQVFRSIDYANTLCLIEQIFVFHENNDGSSLMHAGFCSGTDLNEVKQTLYRLYSDDQASITNGALDLFGVNKGGLISCTPAQMKAQQIMSDRTDICFS